MATFKDRTGRDWTVELDAPLIEEVISKHQINLASLEKDPLIQLRNDPMKLVAVIYVLCQDQIATANLEPMQFAKRLPSPPDPMIDAVREAIIGFFPTGRASHVREVLTRFDEMNEKTDELSVAKMKELLADPSVAKRLEEKATREIAAALDQAFPLSGIPG